MLRRWASLIGLFILAGMVMAQQGSDSSQQLAGSEGSQGTKSKLVYVVQPGDTLWDIAGRFLASSYYWPKIWERNSFIIDPHWIYPGDVLSLYPEGEKLSSGEQEEIEVVPQIEEPAPVVEETQEVAVVTGEEGEVIKVVYKETPSLGWIEPGEMEKAGEIIRTYDGRTMVGEMDIVYVNIGSAQGIKIGDRFSIFRIDQEIRHPITKQMLGYKIINLGELEISKLSSDASEAEIINSYQEIKVGDYLRPYIPPLSAEVPVVKTQKKAEGYIVANKRNTPSFARNDIVYIDLGKADGVEAGNKLEVYIPGEVVKDKTGTKHLPDKIIGKLLVLDPKERTSVALVIESLKEFKIGERIRLGEAE